MTKINVKTYFVISILILSASSMVQNHAFADISNNFGVLASTYANTSPGTYIVGNLGYTTGPALAPTVNGIIYTAGGIYSQAGSDSYTTHSSIGIIHTAGDMYSQAGITQNTATSSANSQACTTNLGTIVDLSTVQGGVYTPGVYCTTGAASIGAGGITLSGNGIYIFKIGGA
ncbi:MAG TPA: ice-binding family protein, partial [Candidatus Acidoferrales bacterium]|nr:ice-binding family protein [Candidatus Acidoferrales bacterium]